MKVNLDILDLMKIFSTLIIVLNCIKSEINGNCVLSLFEQMILCIMQLRLALPVTDLCYQFNILKTTALKTIFRDTKHLVCKTQIPNTLTRTPPQCAFEQNSEPKLL